MRVAHPRRALATIGALWMVLACVGGCRSNDAPSRDSAARSAERAASAGVGKTPPAQRMARPPFDPTK